VSDLNASYVEDLKKMLRDIGYSDDAIKEILKWYSVNN
jgi:uncharacterized membrane-anchored protein